jgi:hypothetical protein
MDAEIEKVASLLADQLDIDWENSVDKRKLLTNQFGYRSLHYVAKLPEHRITMEHENHKDCKIEIQMRTVLQHAWAEIEHDLGYKSKLSIPDEFKRGFNRLAALLETADVEFGRLKKSIDDYPKEVLKKIKDGGNDVTIDQTSLEVFMNQNSMFKDIKNLYNEYDLTVTGTYNFEFDIDRLAFLEIAHIGDLAQKMNDNWLPYLIFFQRIIMDIRKAGRSINITMPLTMFLHYYALIREDRAFLDRYFSYKSPVVVSKEHIEYLMRIFRQSRPKAFS